MKKLLLSCMIALGISASAQIIVNEGFEGTTTPSGWTYSRFSRTTISGYPCAGSAALRANVYGASTTTTYTANAYYASTASNGKEIAVSFKYSTRGFSATAPVVSGTVRAEYSVDGGTTYQLIGSQLDITSHSALCTSFSGTIPAGSVPSDSNFRFRVLVNNSGSGDWYLTVDDVILNQAASCFSASALTSSAVTSNSATINWTAPATAPANGYDLYYSTSATAPISTTTPQYTDITGVSQTLSGLVSNTTYYAWVRSNCSTTDQSSWVSSPVSFKTLCSSFDIPYSQNFNSVTAPALPACTSIQNAGLGNNWATYSFTASNFGFSIGNALRYTYNTANAANAWFYTEGLNLIAGTEYMIRYRAGSSNTEYPDKMKVAIGTSAVNTAMTTVLADHNPLVGASSNVETVYFTPPTSGVYYLGFNAYSNKDMAYIYVDDITVDFAPLCKVPVSVNAATAIGENTATLNWTSSPSSPSGYDIYYSTSATEPTSTTTPAFENIAGNSQVVNGLTAGTNYYVWVRSHCSSSDKSPWVGYKQFSTLCPAGNYNVPYTQDFESAIAPSLPNCTTREKIGNGSDWTVYNNGAASIPGKWLVYNYSTTAAANAWFYTSGINLEAGKEYKISYKYVGTTGYVEKLKVAYGTSPANATMTTVLNDHTSISTAETAEKTFYVPADGVYYFGFNAYSAADQNYLAIDEISVVATGVLGTKDTVAKNISIYPNPFKDVINITDIKGLKFIEVIDASGRDSKKFSAASSLDLSSLPSGLYILNLHYEDGSVKTIKTIKK